MLTSSTEITRIDLLRHGSCAGGEIYRGSTDVPLDASGWRQMEQAAALHKGWQRVVTSPLRRCRDFASVQASTLDVPLQIEDDLREMHFGDWEGQAVAAVWTRYPEECLAFYSDPANVTPPGAEPMPQVMSRARAVWLKLLHSHAGEHILVVSHGGVIRTLLCELLSMPLSAVARIDIPYASVCGVTVYHSENGDFPVLNSLSPGPQP